MSQITKKTDLQNFIETYQPTLKTYALKKYNQSAFMTSVKIAIAENHDLQRALKTPAGQMSLFHALKFASTTGLSLNPQEGKAALITYGDTIQYQVMKNGIIELAMQSGTVEFVTADIVRSNDDFSISKTDNGDAYNFTPARKNRGDVDGYYAAVRLKSGVTHVVYMEKSEIEEHAKKYSALFKAAPQKSPWTKSFDGMALKTVIKRLFRNLNICPELTAAVSGDDENENLPERDVTPGVSADDVMEKLGETEPAKLAVPDQPVNEQKKEKEMF